MTHSGPIARRAVEVAARNVGVLEVGGSNRGAEVEAFLRAVDLPPGLPWCAGFIRWCLETAASEAGLHLPSGFPDSGWCPAFQAWGKRTGNWIPVSIARTGGVEVESGDLALFWFAAKGRVAHIGIVQDTWANGLRTIEGNTGPDRGPGVQREGDGVYQKSRTWYSLGEEGGLVRLPF